MKKTVLALLIVSIGYCSVVDQTPTFAQEPFYRGNTMRLIVGSTPGGFYDRWARMFAKAMPKYIPGNPEIIVQNMPGAGSVVAANYLYNVAKPDGLTMAIVQYSVYMDQLVGRKEAQFAVRRFGWRVEVADQGPGISAADRERLFLRFTRLSARPTGNEGSTGLCLSIVKRLVELHGGSVRAEGAPGEGATFVVELPAASLPAPPPARAGASRTESPG